MVWDHSKDIKIPEVFPSAPIEEILTLYVALFEIQNLYKN
jgi:hypothetical protein